MIYLHIYVPNSKNSSHSPVRQRPHTDDTMKVVLFLAVAGWLAGLCSAHLCLIYPKQRGSLNAFDKPGAPDCYLRTAECGGRMKDLYRSPSEFTRGKNYTLVFQKNLDHHNAANPGFFNISLHNQPGYPVYINQLAFVRDSGHASAAYNSVDVQIPMDVPVTVNPEYFLQVVYDTHTLPFMFYQCADIYVN